MTYKAKLVPMEDMVWDAYIIKCIKGVNSSNVGDVVCIERYNPDIERQLLRGYWQAQRLIITSDEKIKKGDWYMYESPLMIQKCAVYPIFPDKAIKVIAAYPTLPDVPQIDLADVRKWIESGCKESVESEVGRYDMITHESIEPMKWNNTVKMVWGEQDKAQPIAGDNGKPIVVERFACNGEHSHWEVIEPIDGAILWSGEDHHPATDWEALRDKFKELCKYKININDDGIDGIINFFKTEINGK